VDFGQGQIETWEEHHPKTAQDTVEAGVREIELFGVHNLHINVELSPCAFLPRDANHLLGQVDTGDLSAGPTCVAAGNSAAPRPVATSSTRWPGLMSATSTRRLPKWAKQPGPAMS
jgi:hypothetical protein